MNMHEWPRFMRTRFTELGLSKCDHSLWRLVALDDDQNPKAPNVVGPFYKTKAEALGDLERYHADSWA